MWLSVAVNFWKTGVATRKGVNDPLKQYIVMLYFVKYKHTSFSSYFDKAYCFGNTIVTISDNHKLWWPNQELPICSLYRVQNKFSDNGKLMKITM